MFASFCLSKLGPNTVAMLWIGILFTALCSFTFLKNETRCLKIALLSGGNLLSIKYLKYLNLKFGFVIALELNFLFDFLFDFFFLIFFFIFLFFFIIFRNSFDFIFLYF